jgi:hypothetical protein
MIFTSGFNNIKLYSSSVIEQQKLELLASFSALANIFKYV